jgi:asparagine synthase (glutamine-hydrolysing)
MGNRVSRVIDAYLSTVSGRMPSPAAFKPILRAVMADVLPPSLLTRTTKGVYAPDFHHGIRVHRAALTDLVDGHLSAAGLIRPATLKSALDRAAGGIADRIWILDAAITIESWLRAHHGNPLPDWVPAPAEEGTR